MNNLKNRKILVTGGAGFIGSTIVDRLSPENEVTVIDNLSTGLLSNLAKSRDRITFIEGDILDRALVEDIVARVEFVFHLAASVGVVKSIEDPFLDMEVNIRGTLNLLEACLGSNIERFVYTSSAVVYGEPKYLPIDERHPLSPESPYGISKSAAEKYVSIFCNIHGIPTTSLRLFNVYGLGQEGSKYGNVVPILLNKIREQEPFTIFGDGNQTRDFVFVGDVVEAHILAATQSRAIGETFNIASGEHTSVNELVSIAKQVTDSEVTVVHTEPIDGDIRYSSASIAKAKKLLGYNPKTSIREGLLLLDREAKKGK